MANEIQPMTFDYGDLDPSTVSTLESYAEKIRHTAAEGVLKIGAELAQVHELLAGKGRDGLWNPWVKERCGFKKQTAYNYLSAYNSFGKCPTVGHLFQPSAMYLLSADSCPEEATKEAIKRAKKGETITAKVAKEIKEKYVEPEEQEEETTIVSFIVASSKIRELVFKLLPDMTPEGKVCLPDFLSELALELKEDNANGI